jgi:hypothetical protein
MDDCSSGDVFMVGGSVEKRTLWHSINMNQVVPLYDLLAIGRSLVYKAGKGASAYVREYVEAKEPRFEIDKTLGRTTGQWR